MANPRDLVTGEWMDTQSVMRALGISERSVQKRAAQGHLKYKTVQDGLHRFRLYEAASVEQFRKYGPQPQQPKRKPPADIAVEELAAALATRRELPPALPRRSSNLSLPEGKVSVSFPAQLSEESTAQARTFIELVLRLLPAPPASVNVNSH